MILLFQTDFYERIQIPVFFCFLPSKLGVRFTIRQKSVGIAISIVDVVVVNVVTSKQNLPFNVEVDSLFVGFFAFDVRSAHRST